MVYTLQLLNQQGPKISHILNISGISASTCVGALNLLYSFFIRCTNAVTLVQITQGQPQGHGNGMKVCNAGSLTTFSFDLTTCYTNYWFLTKMSQETSLFVPCSIECRHLEKINHHFGHWKEALWHMAILNYSYWNEIFGQY